MKSSYDRLRESYLQLVEDFWYHIGEVYAGSIVRRYGRRMARKNHISDHPLDDTAYEHKFPLSLEKKVAGFFLNKALRARVWRVKGVRLEDYDKDDIYPRSELALRARRYMHKIQEDIIKEHYGKQG